MRHAQKMREELAALVDEGTTREQIIGYYIAKYGSQEPLARRIDGGSTGSRGPCPTCSARPASS